MFRIQDPNELSPDERLTAVAAILARGVIRLRGGGKIGNSSAAAEAEITAAAGLDVVPEMRLTVDSGREAAASNEASRPGAGNT